jgi:hypothetical protein
MLSEEKEIKLKENVVNVGIHACASYSDLVGQAGCGSARWIASTIIGGCGLHVAGADGTGGGSGDESCCCWR